MASQAGVPRRKPGAPRKGAEYSRNGYKNKSHSLELQARDKQGAVAKLTAENSFLSRQALVLTRLLEVSSEIVVHKRAHTAGVEFPVLSDAQLLEFLDEFLAPYGGYSAQRPTEANHFNLER